MHTFGVGCSIKDAIRNGEFRSVHNTQEQAHACLLQLCVAFGCAWVCAIYLGLVEVGLRVATTRQLAGVAQFRQFATEEPAGRRSLPWPLESAGEGKGLIHLGRGRRCGLEGSSRWGGMGYGCDGVPWRLWSDGRGEATPVEASGQAGRVTSAPTTPPRGNGIHANTRLHAHARTGFNRGLAIL